ncbi:DUF3604 domain-containing protein [Lutimonas sp.]|uniref:DUF3604 domain-containing protein n=1 Tax=Lutimonas sp. TaxID=1872403 RepID=UPI003D9BA268
MKLFPLILILVILMSCDKKPLKKEDVPPSSTSKTSGNIKTNPLKNAYFGETHVHTSSSMDAFIGGNRLTPEEAYRFAKGEEVTANGSPHKLKRPLDFCAISDHAEYLGETYTLMNKGTPGYNDPVAKQMREADNYEDAIALFVKYVVTPARTGGSSHPDFYQGEASTMSGWRKNFQATEKYNQPGKFTTLHAFEWSSAPNAGNLHRNVIFRDSIVPKIPFSSNDSRDPQKLWLWMQEQIDNGSTLLAIPHNSNGSKGMMFPEVDIDGDPLDKSYAETRQKMEPLIEMMQIKGNSEVHPQFWANDEFADFEMAYSIQDYSGRTFEKRNYVRYGLERGLKYEKDLGVNPFKYGFVGGTDNHNGTPGNVEEDNYSVGSHGYADRSADNRTKQVIDGWATAYDISPGSLTGVWAESNTREAIWDALYHKETYATSGPRIKVRFFGGYDFKKSYKNQSFIEDGYKKGVPMGGDLPQANGSKPQFIVWAAKDPIGPGLDRIQIIKGWMQNGQMQEKIYNVAVSDNRTIHSDGSVEPIEAPVDLTTGQFTTNKGSSQLMTVWIDPDFDPRHKAFYYVRVLQLPAARWNLYDEIREGVTFPKSVPKTLIERAWSSPIWYSPK